MLFVGDKQGRGWLKEILLASISAMGEESSPRAASQAEPFERLKVWYCPLCKGCYEPKQGEPSLCPSCRQPLEIRYRGRLRNLGGGMVGLPWLFKIRILGEGAVKTVPVRLRLFCKNCGETLEVNLYSEEWRDLFYECFFINRKQLYRLILGSLAIRPCNRGSHRWVWETLESLDYRFGSVEELTEFEDLGERGESVQAVSAILLKRFDSKVVQAECEVFVNPRNELVLLIHDGKPLEEVENPRLTEEERGLIESVFKSRSLHELRRILDRVIAPDVNGRGDAKLAAALTAVSPMWFKVGGREEPVPGCLRTLFYGDPRTGKGMILRWFWRHGLGLHVFGEATGRTGLVWTIDPDLKILRWGALPLADGRLCVIEGLHSLREEEMEQLREALVQQRIEVRRMLTGSAWCRTRIIADSNTASGRSLHDYVFRCQALRDSRCFKNPIDLTRWNIFIPFDRDDVPPEQMYALKPRAPADHLNAFKAVVRWAWSLRTDDIEITEEAFREAVDEYKRMREEFAVGDIPLIHNGTPLNLLRLAVAYAALSFNLLDGKLRVEAEHVREVAGWFRSLLDRWELTEYKLHQEETRLTVEEAEKILERIGRDEELWKILWELGKGAATSDELAGRVDLHPTTVRRRVSRLKELGLVVRRRGYVLTAKAVQFLRFKRRMDATIATKATENREPGSSLEKKLESQNSVANVAIVAPSNWRVKGFYNDEALCELCGSRCFGFYKVGDSEGRVLTVCDRCYRELKGEAG